MANINITTGISDSTDGFVIQSTQALTTSGDGVDYRRIDVTTSEVTHTLDASIGNAGACYIKNRDTANFVEVGFATTVYPIKLLAGQTAIIPLAPATSAIYLKADTATCKVDVYIREA